MICIFRSRHYYHKAQGKQDEHEVGAEELVYQMIQRYPSIHELLKQEHHHQAPKLLLLPITNKCKQVRQLCFKGKCVQR
jgi:hypothetical protein